MSFSKKILRGFRRGMKNFSYNIALIVNTISLSFVYIIGVGITSIIAKLVRKHFLELKLSKKDSYWSKLNLKKRPINHYYRQF